MKKGIVFMLFFSLFVGATFAQQVTAYGKEVAEIKANGDVVINGVFTGIFDKNGDVYKKSERIGQIRANGEYWLEGSKAGRIEADGRVFKSGALVGKVVPDGTVFDAENKKIGFAKNVKREWTIGLFFFYFDKEIKK